MNQSKHPKALPICFLTEMWERFGYVLISMTLVFILIQRFNLDDTRANIIIGSFTAMLYITSVLAGQIADKLIGYYRSILLGGIILVIGYSYLAIANNLLNFCIALGIVCTGTGLLKTNVGSYLGQSYGFEDTNRQGGFTIFYVGLNVGALFGSMLSGYLYELFGGFGVFATSAIMLTMGVLTFFYGFKYFKLKKYKCDVKLANYIFAMVITIMGASLSVIVIYKPAISSIFFLLVIIFSIVVCFKGAKNKEDFNKALSFFIFLIIATSFWALYNQIFMSLNLFVDRVVDHRVFGLFYIPTQSFIVFNPITVIVGGVLLGMLWTKINILDIYKYLLGMFIIVLMFCFVNTGIYLSGNNTTNLVGSTWVILCYVSLGIGELLVSAIGLSIATKLAPKGQTGAYMGLWLVNIGIGGYLAGIIANFAAIPEGVTNIVNLKQIYFNSFNTYIIIAVLAFLFAIVATFFIKKLLKEHA
jgi:POT family proton-dependent oligopeptide transporter